MKKYLQFFSVYIAFAGMYSCEETSIRYTTETLKKPTIFAKGVISSEDDEFNLEFTPDGKTVYFTRRKAGEPQKILCSHFQNNSWSTPEIASFSTERDEMPSITPNGQDLYFASTRPIPNRESKGNFDMNVWVTSRENDSWSNPKPLDPIINKVQIEGEEWPSSTENSLYTQDGKLFYYSTMMRGSKAIGIYTTTLKNDTFSTPIGIEGLFENETYWTSSPVLSLDGNYLLFNAYDTNIGYGGEDIYVSKKTAKGWSKAKVLPAIINSKGEESNPRFSRDGQYFFFAKNEKTNDNEDGIWNIYYMETKYLQLNTLFSAK